MTRLTRTGRVDRRAMRYAPENCNAYRTPEQVAELGASYQAVVLARGSRDLGLRLLMLRNLGMPWVGVFEAVKGGEIA